MDLPDGWIAHDGGPCPVDPNSLPLVKLRDGEILACEDDETADCFQWEHDQAEYDIIAYKPEQPK